MKTFEIELRRTSYMVVTVEAESQDEAEALAWKEIDSRPDSDDASWDIESIEEVTQNQPNQ